MHRPHALTIGLALTALLATSAAARQTKPHDNHKDAAPPAGMGMHGMMPGCEGHATLKTDVTDSLAKVRAARTAGDPAAVTAALAGAERTLAAVQTHFGTCEAKMDKMGKMNKMKGGTPAPKADEHTH